MIKRSILTCIAFLVLVINPVSTSAASPFVAAYGEDITAGESALIRTSKVFPGEDVNFWLRKPDGSIMNFESEAASDGVAYLNVSDYHLREAGSYMVLAKGENFDFSQDVGVFEVFPAAVSALQSEVSPTELVVDSTSERPVLTVSLRDDYGNAVVGHEIRLFSSDSSDEIEAIGSNLSDQEGRVEFRVNSTARGRVSYAAYDMTDRVEITERAQIVYFNDSNYIFNNYAPDDYLVAAEAGMGGPLDRFEFEDVPTTITPGQPISFTVVAYDAADQAVLDYGNEVRFSVVSDNSSFVNLPDDYQFVPEDLGAHTFSLALTFQQTGEYEIEVRDLTNPNIFSTEIFTVTTGSGEVEPPAGSEDLSITNPVPGTYSNNIQVITGFAPASAQVKIFDNEIEIGEVLADELGRFTFTTSPLIDGSHEVYVAEVNEIGTVISSSDAVTFNIDTSAPEISQVLIEPESLVTPGSIVTVKIFVDAPLSQAAMLFNSGIFDLELEAEGFYSTQVSAPLEVGNYPMTFILVDELGNESRFDEESLLGVAGEAEDFETEVSVIDEVDDLFAIPSDSRVTLNWSEPASSNGIRNYRVFYGTAADQLTMAVDTFDDSTTWYVPSLTNGIEYFFAVVGLDQNGVMGDKLGAIVASTPNPLVVDMPSPDVTFGFAGGDAIAEMEADMSNTGPEIWVFFAISLFGTCLYNLRKFC